MGKKTKDKEEPANDKQRSKAIEAVAKYLRFNITVKAAQMKGRNIEYFVGSKAIDCLMASKWAERPKDLDSCTPYFVSRASAVDFCTKMLRQRLFIRLRKVEVTPKSDPPAGGGEEDEGPRRRKPSDKKGESSDGESRKKRKKRFRLELHEQQSTFVDSLDELYYWEYDPPSRTTYIIGAAIVIGAIALTLQPLWPESTRAGVWYASMGLFGVMGFLVLLIVARWFVFGLLQVFTVGKLHFWVLPNLDNEKCGFLESFTPLYSIEWKKEKPTKRKKNEDSNKDTDVNDNGGTEMEAESKIDASDDL